VKLITQPEPEFFSNEYEALQILTTVWLRVVNVGSLRREIDRDFGSGSEKLFYDPPSDTCRDPGRG